MIHVYCIYSWTLIDKLAKVCFKKERRKVQRCPYLKKHLQFSVWFSVLCVLLDSFTVPRLCYFYPHFVRGRVRWTIHFLRVIHLPSELVRASWKSQYLSSFPLIAGKCIYNLHAGACQKMELPSAPLSGYVLFAVISPRLAFSMRALPLFYFSVIAILQISVSQQPVSGGVCAVWSYLISIAAVSSPSAERSAVVC